MNIYLVPLVQYDRGGGKQGTRPAGVENLSSWSTLRVDDSRILVGTPDTLGTLPTGGFQLASDATEKLTAARLRLFANRLGENIDGLRSGKIADLLLDMHTIGADGTKRKPLIASHRDGKKQLELWLGGQLIAVQAVPAGAGVEFSDNFNRADSSTLGASWNEIAAAGEGAANWAISSNTLGHSRDEAIDALLVYDSALSSTDHYCQVDVVKNAVDIGSGEEYGPCVRFDTSGPVCYFGNVVGDQSAHIGSMNTGWSVLASTSSSWSSACTVKLVVNGSSLELFVNGVSKVTLTDSSLTTGVRAGVYGYAGYPSEFDNWEAGTSGASSTNANAGNAAGTGTGRSATTSIAPTGGLASGTGTSGNPAPSVAATAGRAQGTGTANNATVSTASNVSANAGNASGTGTAQNAAAAVAPNAGVGTGTGTAWDGTSSGAQATTTQQVGGGNREMDRQLRELLMREDEEILLLLN